MNPFTREPGSAPTATPVIAAVTPHGADPDTSPPEEVRRRTFPSVISA